MVKTSLDSRQSASAAQFDRQSDRYGKSHILADTQDCSAARSFVKSEVGRFSVVNRRVGKSSGNIVRNDRLG